MQEPSSTRLPGHPGRDRTWHRFSIDVLRRGRRSRAHECLGKPRRSLRLLPLGRTGLGLGGGLLVPDRPHVQIVSQVRVLHKECPRCVLHVLCAAALEEICKNIWFHFLHAVSRRSVCNPHDLDLECAYMRECHPASWTGLLIQGRAKIVRPSAGLEQGLFYLARYSARLLESGPYSMQTPLSRLHTRQTGYSEERRGRSCLHVLASC